MKRRLLFLCIVGACVVLIGCRGALRQTNQSTQKERVESPSTVDHSLFDSVVKQYVDTDGGVDYAGLKQDQALAPYLEYISHVDPASLSEDGQVAFWINVYNATTLDLIASNYPTPSILRLAPRGIFGFRFHLPKVNDVFRSTEATVGGTRISLNDIEHEILRKDFDEPRIHFALVCAARSCPPLRNEAFTAALLDAQLGDQGRIFLHDTFKNQVGDQEETIKLSKIFKWFIEDFGGTDTSLQAFLAPYFEGEVRQKLENGGYRIGYLRYDWSLNKQDEQAL